MKPDRVFTPAVVSDMFSRLNRYFFLIVSLVKYQAVIPCIPVGF